MSRGPGEALDRSDRRSVAVWLLACCLSVYATLVVGGMTRLTRSGLSIVEWQPIAGVVPPLTEAAWEAAFARYRRTPEYLKVNRGMALRDFKSIFWWEYAHRLIARLNAVVFLVPLLVFAWRRRIEPALAARLIAVFGLGSAQGALGWYMVRSGLVDDPRVSPYRLAAHLALTFLIFAALLWLALDQLAERRSRPGAPAVLAATLAGLVLVTAASGGLVAGLHAGLVSSSFPLMEGRLIPAAAFLGRPWYRDLVTNPVTVQWLHRVLAALVSIAGMLLVWRARRAGASPRARDAAHLVLAALGVQVTLGAVTVVQAVPLAAAAAHQAGALLLFASVVWLTHELSAARGRPLGGHSARSG